MREQLGMGDSLLPLLMRWITLYGYAGIFSALVLGIAGIPIPDEILLTFAGYLVYKGELHVIPTAAAAWFGSMCGITLSYLLGRTAGAGLLRRYGPALRVRAGTQTRIDRWFHRLGRWALTFGYFIPGVRHGTAIVAGASKLEYPWFALFAYPGALIWTTTFLTLGYFLGEDWAMISSELHRFFLILPLLVLAAIGLYAWRRGRRPR